MTPRHLQPCQRCGVLPRLHYTGSGVGRPCTGYLGPGPRWLRLLAAVLGK